LRDDVSAVLSPLNRGSDWCRLKIYAICTIDTSRGVKGNNNAEQSNNNNKAKQQQQQRQQ